MSRFHIISPQSAAVHCGLKLREIDALSTVDDVLQCDMGAESVASPLRAHTPQSIVTYGVAD